MQEVEVLKTIPELVCSYFSEEQFTLSNYITYLDSSNVSQLNFTGVVCPFLRIIRLLTRELIQSFGVMSISICS